MNPVIRLQHVSKSYGPQLALDDVSLEVPAGVVCALLGENGAGKTTAIRVLLGLTRPDTGEVSVLDVDSVKDGAEVRRQIGYVPERPTLYDWMTVREIGWFTAGFYGGEFYKHYLERSDAFQLPLGRQIKQLSKGMRAKVSLALALAHEPRVLILDEPTSGLDTMVRREFLEGMVDIAATGRTVLLSSHQISEVERVADMVAILHSGRLLLVEKLDDLKDQVCEINLTLADGVASAPAVQGQVLTLRRHRQQLQLYVRSTVPLDFELLRSQEGVRDLEIRRPSLEEIFVSYLKAADDGLVGSRTGAEVTLS